MSAYIQFGPCLGSCLHTQKAPFGFSNQVKERKGIVLAPDVQVMSDKQVWSLKQLASFTAEWLTPSNNL